MAVYLVDHDHVDATRVNINEKLLECWPFHRDTGEAAIVIVGWQSFLSLTVLALDVVFAGFPLSVE